MMIKITRKTGSHALTSLLLALATLNFSGCAEERSSSNRDTLNPVARFDPANGIIPFPNNMLFSGSTDGTLNIPVADASNYSDPQVALNTLDGFSTIAPITASFSEGLDADSLIAGDTVRLFKVTLSGVGGAVTSIISELTPQTDYTVSLLSADSNQATVTLLPLQPLEPNTSYLVTLSNGITGSDASPSYPEFYYAMAKSTSSLIDAGGVSLYSALSDEEAQALEPLRQLTVAAETAVKTFTIDSDTGGTITDLPSSDIILSWNFTTQSIGNVLSSIWSNTSPQTATTTASGMNTSAIHPDLPGQADIHTGTLNVPYYLTAAADSHDTAPLNSFWHGPGDSMLSAVNSTPVATSTQTIPLLMTLPNSASGHTMPAAGWPVVIFQHGITRSRADLVAVADALAASGFAAVAIDLPLHGITDGTSVLYNAALERTYNLDLIDVNKALIADGVVDPSGSHYVNFTNLLVGRDNLRQSVSDLMTLYASLGNISGLDSNQVFFAGHSLGAMMGIPFLNFETMVQDAVLAMPGSAIAKLLDGSATYGIEMAASLATFGLIKGTPEYESFLTTAQTVLDSADPLNYSATIGNGRGVLLFEVVGGTESAADLVVPNNLWPYSPPGTVASPTAGTDPLARDIGLQLMTQSTSGNDLKAWVSFNAGHHSSLVSAYDANGLSTPTSVLVTVEMQSQMATFLATGGANVTITDPTVIYDPATVVVQ